MSFDEKYANELLTIKLRYKNPKEDKSNLIVQAVEKKEVDKTSENFNFSAAVAGFGMLLRSSDYRGNTTYEMVKSLAEQGKGEDKNGYRTEFIDIVKSAEAISSVAKK